MPHWRLRGSVEPGMFTNERVFMVKDHAGNTYAVTVPSDFVDEADGTVRVRLIRKESDVSLVSVLGESASKTVSVNNSQLVEA